MLLARPQAHLVVLGLLPAGHQVDAEAAGGDRVDGRGHAGHDGRRDGQGGGGGEDLDPVGHGRQAGHQGEALQIVLPELGLAAEPAQLDHREREVEAVLLGLLHDLLVQREARHVLRSRLGDQPAVVADRNEDADFHINSPLEFSKRLSSRA
ncbi:hypothetical protein D3C87_1646980 [compost metagenome]